MQVITALLIVQADHKGIQGGNYDTRTISTTLQNKHPRERELKVMKHIIFLYKGKVYTRQKDWDFNRIEAVLHRLGCQYWEIGI